MMSVIKINVVMLDVIVSRVITLVYNLSGALLGAPQAWTSPGTNQNTKGRRLSTFDLLNKIACFVQKLNNIFNMTSLD
jgi:hypothetical protein